MRIHARVAFALLLFPLSAAAEPADDARSLLRSGRPDHAVEELRLLSDQFPDDGEVRCVYAQALAWNGRYAEAEEHYARVLAAQPGHRDALLGLARLRGYQGRTEEGISLLDRGLGLFPGDPEMSELRRTFRARLLDCRPVLPYSVYLGYAREDYSFAPLGRGYEASWQARDRGPWSGGITLSHQRRFGLQDTDAGFNISRALRRRGTFAGLAAGAASKHDLLPAARFAVHGGAPLPFSLAVEAAAGARRYNEAKVYDGMLALSWEGPRLLVLVRGGVSDTRYASGEGSGALYSSGVRLQGKVGCRWDPWASYARAKEPFEAGFRGSVKNFSAHHYVAGITVHDVFGVKASFFVAREKRPTLDQRIDRAGVGMTWGWGGRLGG